MLRDMFSGLLEQLIIAEAGANKVQYMRIQIQEV
jgi:hypothetical protein